MHAQSTSIPRTKMSLQLVLAALYPPKETSLEWNKNLNWQPIPYTNDPIEQDVLLLPHVFAGACPRYEKEFKRVLNSEMKDELEENSEMFEELSNFTGWNITTPKDIQHLYDVFKTEASFCL